ncbi:MAG: rnr [Firmicutes bacterium]|nr:rnr [Bacillota bacterium]
MTLDEKILTFMREDAYRPLSAEDLAEEMELKAKDLADFWSILDKLEAEAAIIKTRFGKYGVPERMNLVVGTLSAHAKGFGFVVPDNPAEPDVYIPSDALLNAMNKDRVVARIHSQATGLRREGEIIRIVRRANLQVVGTFETSRHFGFVTPDDARITQDIFIPREDWNEAKSGARVTVEITKWPEKKRNAEGKIIEILGYKGDPGLEITAIIKSHQLPLRFPAEVEQAAMHVEQTIQESEIAGRRDLRSVPMVTIDSEDARDLDDAVDVQKLPNGRYLLGVHIADVSYYVQENSLLDQEARQRATSVYLVDRVLPMLPPRLSNGICSLNAGEDRLAMSIQMEIDPLGRVLQYEIFPSVIRVKTRLSYTIVRQIVADRDETLRQEYKELVPQIEEMEGLCHILRQRRMKRGAIDFDFPELKVKLDEQGRPLAIVKRVRTIAESIIEEFMLVANETVAEHMHGLGVPFVFRVHEEPAQEKMEKLNKLLHTFGQRISGTDDVQPIALQKVLARIAGRPEERIISTVMLRSLKQAKYQPENVGHFGLAATYYTHFTSPIRRYPDLIVHRLIRETLQKGGISSKRREKLATILPEITLHSSQQERAAADAERDTVDLKLVEYMAQFINDEFDGVISGVTAFGLFVELENGVEGLVHVSAMDDDYYHYLEDQYALIGERTKKTYRLGDDIKVILTKVNAEERSIDFALHPQTMATRRPGRKEAGEPRGYKKASKKADEKKPAAKKAKKRTADSRKAKPQSKAQPAAKKTGKNAEQRKTPPRAKK